MEGLGQGVHLSADELRRYSRQLLLPEVGREGQKKLQQARVLVVGAGGLGCPALSYLAAAGVGTIGIADGDVVEESNLQRQVLYTTADIGTNKAGAAVQRLTALNPCVDYIAYTEFLGSDNAHTIIDGFDIVVDGSDNFPTRYLLNDICEALGTPLVFGSVQRFEGQAAVFNYNGGATYRCLYPEPPDPRDAPSCSEIGVLGVLPGIIGCIQATEVLKIILGVGDTLAGKLLVFDARTMQTAVLDIPRQATLLREPSPKDYDTVCTPSQTAAVCSMTVRELHQRLLAGDALYLVDVRTADERAICSLGGLHLPLSEFEARLGELPTEGAVVVYCHKGIRSRQAATVLAERGRTAVYTLTGGIDRWAREIDAFMKRY